MSGEQLLELCDKAFVPLVGVSLSTMASIVVPIYSRLGVWTGKSRSEVLSAPIGKVLVQTSWADAALRMFSPPWPGACRW
jgi:hypothetical protein